MNTNTKNTNNVTMTADEQKALFETFNATWKEMKGYAEAMHWEGVTPCEGQPYYNCCLSSPWGDMGREFYKFPKAFREEVYALCHTYTRKDKVVKAMKKLIKMGFVLESDDCVEPDAYGTEYFDVAIVGLPKNIPQSETPENEDSDLLNENSHFGDGLAA